ncbi:hypothetical protein C7I87_21070 [Mesorhizobium sp. SARCC-RB16n]|uniref:DUF6932 family protein n=1 Tax=Mesorhizobium sp. SARCC-RB16n TaxID=2116687 RepID=UPI001253AD6B|nr:hypothetical protein C7I87_21070 [Mesorhizobium sp. SARCC-RB16n]
MAGRSLLEAKEPNDLDTVSFIYRPLHALQLVDWAAFLAAHQHLVHRGQVKMNFRLDVLFVELNGHPETIVEATRYYMGLFSHRRGDDIWKGMLKARLENAADDTDAVAILGPAAPARTVVHERNEKVGARSCKGRSSGRGGLVRSHYGSRCT